MAPRQKQKRQDEIRQAPVSEAIAIGTAAGGLVLGTIQALGTEDSVQQTEVQPVESTPDRRLDSTEPLADKAEAQAPEPSLAPATPTAVAAAPVVVPAAATANEPAEMALLQATPAAPAVSDMAAAAAVPNTIPAPVQSQLVTDLSEQMTATLVKVIGTVGPSLSPDELGQSIASDIIQSAQQIVSNLDIGPLLANTQNLADSVVAQVGAPQIVAEVLGATSGIADTVLAGVDDLPTGVLDAIEIGDTLNELATLPSSLLGNDGPEGSGGLLSEVFYADGASDGLDIPDLSQGAGSLVADIGGGVTGLLGLSYTESPDQHGGNGLNALSLL